MSVTRFAAARDSTGTIVSASGSSARGKLRRIGRTRARRPATARADAIDSCAIATGAGGERAPKARRGQRIRLGVEQAIDERALARAGATEHGEDRRRSLSRSRRR